ncbi:MAG: DUF1553 domain-containing protein [Planctomycetia bacterium]|nr:DUF1553 domain-containing protein [Planctomycetia bacterium]
MRHAGLIFAWAIGSAQFAAAAEPVDYGREIKPIFVRHCYACHGALKQQSGLRLDTATAIRRGGDSGAAVEPGKSGESLLIDAVTGANGVTRMPPKDEGGPLKSEEIAALKRWIDSGAAGPTDEQPQSDPRKHWAFQQVVRPAVPRVSNAAAVANPIDAFLVSSQETRQLVPAPEASRSALLRRVTLDLVGLPPTREELHAFLSDTRPDAYDRVVERLLESPQYGERWARHWMDVWRYSDWYGRRAVPDIWNSAPQIWRWRDWIVRSLNDDKGYDRMVQEMLAADEIAPGDEEAGVATGYIVRNWYALNPNQWMKDMVEHTGKAFLGLTFNCAHCHDHKYDPISNEDYFRFRAFFEPVQLRQDWVEGEPDPGPFQKYEYAVLRKLVKPGMVRIFDENLAAETRMYRQGDERAFVEGRPPVPPGAPAFLGGDKFAIAPIDLPVGAWYPGLKPFIQKSEIDARQADVQKARTILEAAQRALVGAVARMTEVEGQRLAALASAPAGGTQPAPHDPRWLDRQRDSQTAWRNSQAGVKLAEAQLASAQSRLDSSVARIGADNARFRNGPGDAVELSKVASRAERTARLRGALEQQVLAEQAATSERLRHGTVAAGTTQEPLPATVKAADEQLATAVQNVAKAQKDLEIDSTNYSPIGQVYPGKSTGRRTALARWIANRDNPLTARVAVNHIWLRHFGRALVETTGDFGVNGQRPTHPELLDWLAAELMDGGWKMKHVHRLIVTSKSYRAASSGAEGHPSAARDVDNRWYWRFTARRMEAEVVRDSLLHLAGQLDLTTGGMPIENDQELASRRRSLYFSIHPEGGGHPQMLELFDAPDPCDCYRRTESLVPQQALALANGPLALDQSRLLARQLWKESAGRESDESCRAAFVTAAFEQILSRGPSAAELAACQAFLSKQIALFQADAPAATPREGAAAGVPASTDPTTRAAENLVHALFSHNDFLSIR